MSLPRYKKIADYAAQQEVFKDFLQSFKAVPTEEAATAEAMLEMNLNDQTSDEYDMMDDDEAARDVRRAQKDRMQPRHKYMELLQKVADRYEDEVTIDLEDLALYEEAMKQLNGAITHNLVQAIETNAAHYLDIACRAVDEVIPEPTRDISFKDDVLDIIMSQRSQRNAVMSQAAEENPDTDASMFPPELTRRYTLNFKPRAVTAQGNKAFAVREVRGEHLGHLITVRGIATRVSDVKPAVLVDAYSCDTCGSEIFQPVGTKSYSPLTECPSPDCKTNQSKGQLFPSTRASKFLPFQEVKIQEMAEQVPVGHIPRTMTILCHGALVRRINPGDVVDVAGIFLPTPYTGFKALRAGLMTDTYLEAQFVTQHKKAYDDLKLDPLTVRRFEQHRNSGHLYEYLAKSIAPEIYGHLDVKKALLLLLVGGVTKEMGDGMKIRGDINICLMGDPGVAKSQLLKYITKVAPRGVYTTGRGSSGVGLTAAVMRDPVTDEMILEGGALVLADNGICCIDEFDKMDDNDRTAIHEVMEQQTISIAKAGISTTLNARTSILAAANPLYGRYNPRISPVENINLPAALLSRFDVLFLILDTPTRDNDMLLAQHVTFVHMNNKHPESEGVIFTPNEIRQYVAEARKFRPVVPQAVSEYLVKAYVKMRDQQGKDEKAKRQFSHTSARTLLGTLRLAQALARLRFSNRVEQDDVDEALRLVAASKDSLYVDAAPRHDSTPTSKIFNLIKDLRGSRACWADPNVPGELSIRMVHERVLAKGFTVDQLDAALTEYEGLSIWQTMGQGARLVFIDGAIDENME